MKPENLKAQTSVTIKDLNAFQDVPFLVFIKDEAGKYLWSNQAVTQIAQGEITGKTDYELMSTDTADALRKVDRQVWETGSPCYLQEMVEAPDKGEVPLKVYKFVGEFDGQKCLIGVASMIDQ